MNRGACRQQKVHLGPAERQSAVDAEEFEQSSHTLALALLLFMEGQLEKAVDELRNCITANPGCRPAILFLASIYGNMGLPDKGLRLIDELKDKRSTEFVWFKATLLLHQKINRPDEVVALLRPYVEGHDADENLLSLLLLAYLRKGETERVITISHRLRDLSTSIEPLVVFCQKPPKENHPKDVIQIISHAPCQIRCHPRIAVILAAAYLQIGDCDKAQYCTTLTYADQPVIFAAKQVTDDTAEKGSRHHTS